MTCPPRAKTHFINAPTTTTRPTHVAIMNSHRPSSPEPGQVTEFRRGSDGRERRRSASPPTSLPPRHARQPSPPSSMSTLPPRHGRPPSPPRGQRPPSPPPRSRIPPPPRRTDRERWDSPSGRIDRPVMYDRYSRESRDSRDSREDRFARRGSSPGSRGSVSRGGTPAREAREIPKEPVFKGLDGLTQ